MTKNLVKDRNLGFIYYVVNSVIDSSSTNDGNDSGNSDIKRISIVLNDDSKDSNNYDLEVSDLMPSLCFDITMLILLFGLFAIDR